MRYTNVFFVLLLFAVMIFISGCGLTVPAEYKNNKCASTCYPSMNGLDPKAMEIYKQDKTLFNQVEKPVCRNLRELNWSEQQIKDLACSGQQTATVTQTCNGCDTFCDCQLKDGRYLVPIIAEMWDKKYNIQPTNGTIVAGQNPDYAIKISSTQKSIKKIHISGVGDSNSLASVTIYAFNLTMRPTLKDELLCEVYVGKEGKAYNITTKDLFVVNSEEILYGPINVSSANWGNIELDKEIQLPSDLDVFVQISGIRNIELGYHNSNSAEGNSYGIRRGPVPVDHWGNSKTIYDMSSQIKCLLNYKDQPPVDFDISVE